MLIGFHFFRFLSLAGTLVLWLIMIVGGLPCLADMGDQQASQKGLQTLFDPKGRPQSAAADLKALPPGSRQTECGYQSSNVDAENLRQSRDDVKKIIPIQGLSQHECLANSGDIVKQWTDGNVTVIDVRPPKDYERFHLPGSLNISAYSIKTKSFLKTKSLVLIDDGVSAVPLLAACDSLKVSGFSNVKVFSGGVHVWQNLMGGNADFARKQDLQELTPKQFVSVKNERQWLIVLLDEDSEGIKKDFDRSRIVSYSKIAVASAQEQNKMFASRSPVSDRRLLFVSRDGAGYSEIDAGVFKAYSNSMYYLVGGLREYREYVETRSALLARANAGPRKEKGCGL